MILIPLNVFSNYAYCVKISNFYFHFFYGKTLKEDPNNFKAGKNGHFYANFLILIDDNRYIKDIESADEL